MPKVVGSLVVPTLAAAPSSPVAGQTYYDTAKNQSYVYNGTIWLPSSCSLIWDSVDAGVSLPAASISTPTLPTNFKHLLVAYEGDCSIAGVQYLGMRFNGISTASYYGQRQLTNNGAYVTPSVETAQARMLVGLLGGTSNSTYRGNGLIFIGNYNAGGLSHPVTGLSSAFQGSGTSNFFTGLFSYMYGASSLAVTSLTFLEASGSNLDANCRFSVYGLA